MFISEFEKHFQLIIYLKKQNKAMSVEHSLWFNFQAS